MLDRIGGKHERYRKDHHAAGFEEAPGIDKRTRNRRRDVLKNVAGDDEVVACVEFGCDIGDIEPRFGIKIGVGVRELLRKRVGVRDGIGKADPLRSKRGARSGSATLQPKSARVRRWTMARSRTVEPHRAHEGCSRCSAFRATPLADPHRLQRKSTLGSPVEGGVR